MTSKTITLNPWVALAIGNSRLHWAFFTGDRLQQTQDTPHLDPTSLSSNWYNFFPTFAGIHESERYPELWLASVVPVQTQIWQQYPNLNIIQLADIPLQNIYPTLGLDRAIALWGAGVTYGWPTLVIDGGTALTLTGADTHPSLIGGAILPGLRLQMQSLQIGTAALPLVELPAELPPPWAKETAPAIQSGILYTAIAGLNSIITQWVNTYPNSQIVLTGGDAQTLATYFRQWQPHPPIWLNHLVVDLQLVFHGFSALRAQPLSHPKS